MDDSPNLLDAFPLPNEHICGVCGESVERCYRVRGWYIVREAAGRAVRSRLATLADMLLLRECR